MKLLYNVNGEEKKVVHHKDILIPEGIEFTIPEEKSGCKEQRIVTTKVKSVRFRTEIVDLDKRKVWSGAVSPKKFFRFSIRLTKPYVYNLKEIQDDLACAFLNLPKGMARGTIFDDLPGNITSRSVIGMKNYNPNSSERTLELAELIGPGEIKNCSKRKSFDYWVFDQNMLDEGFVLTVGNEDGTEFVRKLEIGSLPEGEDVVTAYVRPWICENYNI